ncbi:uncharacterized protein GIQ15_03193 [Arthroderma uncinatum]|uniref:uncharacterized protein n=1 Tax=Arthroderma uncinatum TaxID=74035 RepID=UPI00144A530E|nr:uncharacterized protein GIQ15_03193 [Arthroderma uncinatum]KAF3483869.1 hypothetical protein GIQ15_03193 [Arthroderma uncinatum]
MSRGYDGDRSALKVELLLLDARLVQERVQLSQLGNQQTTYLISQVNTPETGSKKSKLEAEQIQMAYKLRTTQRNERTVSTGGSSDWRSVEGGLTGYDAGDNGTRLYFGEPVSGDDNSIQSTGQKLANGFEKDYAVDISSLLTPDAPKTIRYPLNGHIPASRTKAKGLSASATSAGAEDLSVTIPRLRPKVLPKGSKGSKSGPPKAALKSRINPDPPTLSQNTSEMQKPFIGQGVNQAPPTRAYYRRTSSLDNMAGFSGTRNGPKPYSQSTSTLRNVPDRSRTGSNRLGHSRDASGRRLRSYPSLPLSPILSDEFYNDGMSSIINTTVVFPNIPYESKRSLRSSPSLPPSPAISGDPHSDEISCAGSPTLNRDMSLVLGSQEVELSGVKPRTTSNSSAPSRYPFSNKSRMNSNSTAPFRDNYGTRFSSHGVGLSRDISRTVDSATCSTRHNFPEFVPYQRPPLRDLSSNGLRTRDAIRRDAQVRSASISSSQKENFGPRELFDYHEHGSPSGRENIPRNRSDNSVELFGVTEKMGTGALADSCSSSDISLPISVKKRSTRFSQHSPASNKRLLPSSNASENSTVVFQSRDRSHHSPRNTRFAPKSVCSSPSISFRAVDAAPPPTVSVGSLSIITDRTSTMVHIPRADNRLQGDVANTFEPVSGLQTRLQCLEKEKKALDVDVQRLSNQNVVLFDRVQALEIANCTAAERIGELRSENIGLNTRLQVLESGAIITDEHIETLARNNCASQAKEVALEQVCSVADDNFKTLAEEGTVLEDRTGVLEEAESVMNDRVGMDEVAGATESRETPLEDTLLSLVSPDEVEDLRRKLEATRVAHRAGKPCRGVSLQPLSPVLASIGVGVEITEPGSPQREDEDLCPLPPVRKWIRRGP